jgi:hypothetical protein
MAVTLLVSKKKIYHSTHFEMDKQNINNFRIYSPFIPRNMKMFVIYIILSFFFFFFLVKEQNPIKNLDLAFIWCSLFITQIKRRVQGKQVWQPQSRFPLLLLKLSVCLLRQRTLRCLRTVLHFCTSQLSRVSFMFIPCKTHGRLGGTFFFFFGYSNVYLDKKCILEAGFFVIFFVTVTFALT